MSDQMSMLVIITGRMKRDFLELRYEVAYGLIGTY